MKNFLNFRGVYDNVYAIIPLKFVDKNYAEMVEQRKKDIALLNKATELKIWNGLNISGVALRYEAILMLMRSVGKSGGDKEILDEAKKEGIRNGLREMDPVLRYEAVLTIMRSKGYEGDDVFLLQKAKELGIWNGLRGTSIATRQEVVLMIMRNL